MRLLRYQTSIIQWQQDSWAWVGYVLGDVYVFAILLHASIAWLPRPLAAMEFAKYSPLENSRPSSIIDDAELWVRIAMTMLCYVPSAFFSRLFLTP